MIKLFIFLVFKRFFGIDEGLELKVILNERLSKEIIDY